MAHRLQRFKNPDVRRAFGFILAGKMVGIGAVLGAMKAFTFFLESPAGATPVQDVVHEANDFISPINTIWVLVAAFLVFFMQASAAGIPSGSIPSTVGSGPSGADDQS